MNINKSISYILYNKGIIVNFYKLHSPSFPFSFQSNKRVFYPPTFPTLQPNTQEGKPNIFYPPTFSFSHNFLFSHFFTSPTKQTLNVSLTQVTFFDKCLHELIVSLFYRFWPKWQVTHPAKILETRNWFWFSKINK